jgi:hypothetical protein
LFKNLDGRFIRNRWGSEDMYLHGIIGDIFGGADQLLVEGD